MPRASACGSSWLSVESRRVALATIATPSRADAPRRRPVAAVRHATAAEAPPTHWAGRQKARAALASATRLMSESDRASFAAYDVEFVVEISRCRAPLHLFALCMSGQAAAGHYHRAALLQPDFAHCAQPPEHHHRPASCHGELLLRPLARLSRWHTLAICCSRSASSSPHSCHGAVTTHLLAGLSRAGSPAGATRRPLSLVHHGPQRPASSVREERQCAGTVEPEHRVLDACGVKFDLMWPNMQ